MTAILVAWGCTALVLIGLGVLLGAVITHHPLGLLIDERGRYSLTHFQVVLWTLTILSLVFGTVLGRVWHGATPLGFSIPDDVLGLMGISVGSSVVVSGAKRGADALRGDRVAAVITRDANTPGFSQIFMLEEGAMADKAVDVTKFQGFIITLILVVAYIVDAAHAIEAAHRVTDFTSLPNIRGEFLVLLGISHAGYLGGKIVPTSNGAPSGDTIQALKEARPPANRAERATTAG
jgi:hypothetical protein